MWAHSTLLVPCTSTISNSIIPILTRSLLTDSPHSTLTRFLATVPTVASLPHEKSKSHSLRSFPRIPLRQLLPSIPPPSEVLQHAHKQVHSLSPNTQHSNIRTRARTHATTSLTTLSQALCLPMRNVLNTYRRNLHHIHPFERVVLHATMRAYEKQHATSLIPVLQEFKDARKELLLFSKDWTHKAKHVATAREANQCLVDGSEALVALFQELCVKPLQTLRKLQNRLRKLPDLQLQVPTVVLVGSPNVGKSSLVRCVSSGTPEVNNYPFTTRGLTVGHVEVHHPYKGDYDSPYGDIQLCQVMDSPGLLVREQETQRNEMEDLTIAAMQHLPTAVMYVMDLSGGAGDACSSVQDQLTLRREFRRRFPKRPWVDVVSKCELGMAHGIREQFEDVLQGSPYIEVSCLQGTGVKELTLEMTKLLGDVRVVLDVLDG